MVARFQAEGKTRAIAGADVRTMTGGRAEAIAWRDGWIIAVGSRADVAREAPDAEIVEARGATVLPGFIDAHHHPCIAALYGGLVRLTPPAVTDIPGIQRALAAASKELAPGRWLVAMDWDENKLAEGRRPTRAEIDDAVPDRPVFALHYSCHSALANSRALELAGIDRDTPEPSGGVIARGKNRVPDGNLFERGMSRVERLARASLVASDLEGYFTRLAEHHRALVRAGITRVVDCAVPPDLGALYREAARRGILIVPTVMFPVSATGYLEAPWDVLDGPVTGEEEGLLTVGPVKLVFDSAPVPCMCLDLTQALASVGGIIARAIRSGSLDAARTARSTRMRLERGKIRTGFPLYRRDEAEDIVRAATEAGFAVGTHAIGNEAIDFVLSTYARVPARGLRRIEHGTFLDTDMVKRAADLGVGITSQPAFIMHPMLGAVPAMPRLRYMPHRWLIDAGVKVAGSSDYPVAGIDPLDGIRGAVFRRTASGHVHEPDQRIDVDEAVALYTRTAAEISLAGTQSGTLEPGKRADLVILDPPLADLERARVRATVIGGEMVYERS
jgi:hypothetical protein